VNHPDLIVALAARYKLPAVYPFRFFVTAGGLISYGPDPADPYRRAAGYVIASSRARNRPTRQYKRRPSTSWSSISKPQRRSASTCADATRPRRRGDRMNGLHGFITRLSY
jgi:hypothetical protein